MNRVFMLDKSFEDLDLLVVEWAREKGILQVADAKSQADRKSTRLNSSH